MKRRTTSLLLTGILASAIPASGAIIAGWDNFTHTAADTFDANIVNGVTAQMVGTSATDSIGWGNWNNATGASTDGTWGTVTGDVSPSTTALADGSSSVGLRNSTSAGELTLTITNTSGFALDLTSFHFDGITRLSNGPGDWALSILSGSAVTQQANIATGTVENVGAFADRVGEGYDIDLTGLADRTFDNGESVVFELAFTGGVVASTSGGHNTMIDNLAISAVPEPATYALFAGFLALGVIIRRRVRA